MEKQLENETDDDIDTEVIDLGDDYEDEDDFDDDYEMDDRTLYDAENKALEEELDDEDRNGDYSDVWYDKDEVKKENTVKMFQFVLKCLVVTICLALVVYFMSRLHRSSNISLTQYLPSMADKQKLVQNSSAEYTPSVVVAAGESEAAAPHIVVDVDDDQKAGTTQNSSDKSPLI